MGTRADFYIGRGKSAEWLGSIAWDGYPSGIQPKDSEFAKDAHLFDSATADEFKERLEMFFAGREDVTRPERGWPWPWDDSKTTDYAYCFDGGRVWFYGYPVTDTRQNKPQCWVSLDGRLKETLDVTTPEEYPDMSDRKNVTLGRRSGIIVIGSPYERYQQQD